MERKLISILLVLAMAVTFMPVMALQSHAAEEATVPAGATTMTAWAEGGYSESVTDLTINNEEDFKAFQDAMCGSAAKTFEGYTVYLTADLDLNPDWSSRVNLEWGSDGNLLAESAGVYQDATSVGESGYMLPATNDAGKIFNGTFDGMGHSISGLYLSMDDENAASLFGKTTGKNTVVKNLAVLDSYFQNGVSTDKVKPLAGLLTIIEAGAKATISNCYVDVDLRAMINISGAKQGQQGGLVGYCQGELVVEDTVYAGSITASNSKSGGRLDQIGGIVGYVVGTQAAPVNVTVNNYVFTGSIYSKDQRISGGIGRSEGYANITMTNCLYLGKVRASTNAGAFHGSLVVQGTTVVQNVTMTDCYLNGNVVIGGTQYNQLINPVGTTNSPSNITVLVNGTTKYSYRHDGTTVTTTGAIRSADYKIKETAAETLAMPIGGEGTKTLSNVYIDNDGTIVPKALNETFGEDTHMLLGESMTVWATGGYADLTTKVLRIKTTADFKAFQTAMCTDGQTFEDYTVYLTADLAFNTGWRSSVHLDWGANSGVDGYGTLSGDSVQYVKDEAKPVTSAEDYYALPVTGEKTFNGTFDGMGHSVSGLYYNGTSTIAISLFGQVTGTAEIKNLAVLNSYFENTHSASADGNQRPIGGLFSIVNTGAAATITNCYVDVDLYEGKAPKSEPKNGRIGGLVGYCTGTLIIKDSVYAGSVSCNYIAGAAAGARHIGGAVGWAQDATITMEDFVFTGVAYNKWQRVSGGIGRVEGNSTVNMTRCMNLGRVYAGNSSMYAALIGSVPVTVAQTVTLNDCYTVTNDTEFLLLKAGAKVDGASIAINWNGASQYDFAADNTTGTVKRGSENCLTYRNSNGYTFTKDARTTLANTPYGGVEGRVLSDVFVQIGATIVPKNLHQAIAPTITAKSRTISLEGNIWINRYVNFSGFSGINLEKNAGLLIWNAPISEDAAVYGAKDSAGNAPIDQVGLFWDSEKGAYGQRTDGITAPHYGDKLYMRAYVKVGDDYIYGGFTEYSVADYCTNRIKDSADEDVKKLCAAVLNYGAAAQIRFGYNTDNLVNANLSADMTTAYDASMIKALNTVVDTAITDNASTIVEKATKSISLDEGIRINYYFKPVANFNSSIIASAELLTWSGVAGELTEENAQKTGLTRMSDGRYAASGALVPAADCGETIYACAKFVDTDGNVYYTAVTGYSAHRYAANMLEKETTKQETCDVLEALIVYSYLADKHFAD